MDEKEMLTAMAERAKIDLATAQAREDARFAAELAGIVAETCKGRDMSTAEVSRLFGVSRAVAKDAMAKLERAGGVDVANVKPGTSVPTWRVKGEASAVEAQR